MKSFDLLGQLCSIHAPSGDEQLMLDFCTSWLQHHNKYNSYSIDTEHVNNAIIVHKGNPRIAMIAHMDSTGFMLQYGNKLLPLGGPSLENEAAIVTCQNQEFVEAKVTKKEDDFFLQTDKTFERGTTFSYKPDFFITDEIIQSPYLDNRLGVFLLLNLLLEAENVMIVLSTNEEHSGGCVEKVARVLFEHYHITKTIIVDTTFETEGIVCGKGPVLSLKDRLIPPKKWLDEVRIILNRCNIPFQLEVEDYGSSDGAYIHRSPYPIDWCFLGIAGKDNHSPKETVYIKDVDFLFNVLSKLMVNG
jgi:putative aminopeptidase FrvX